MVKVHARLLSIVAVFAFLLGVPTHASAWSGFFNYPNAGWYLFKGPFVQPRFGVYPSYALDHLEYQHVGAGYGGFAAFYPTIALGYGPYPNWGYTVPKGGIAFPRRMPPTPQPPAAPSVHEACAQFTVIVPEDAAVWIEGNGTQQTGTVRRFVSPPLEPGANFAYRIHARWRESGRIVEQDQEIVVKAGEKASVKFPRAD